MPCPLFRDYTRHCIEKFPNFVVYSNYDVCFSDDYTKCMMYEVIQSDFNCKYLTDCSEAFLNAAPEFIMKMLNEEKINVIVREMNNKYCLSEDNCKNCARYKRFDIGEKPSLRLFPDGKSHFLDIILKRKITIE